MGHREHAGLGLHRQAQGIERTRHQAGQEPKQAPVQTTGPSLKAHTPGSCHRCLFSSLSFRHYVSLSFCLSLSLSMIPCCLNNDFSGCSNGTGLVDHSGRGNDLLSPHTQRGIGIMSGSSFRVRGSKGAVMKKREIESNLRDLLGAGTTPKPP